jgi:hypothetical protein
MEFEKDIPSERVCVCVRVEKEWRVHHRQR